MNAAIKSITLLEDNNAICEDNLACEQLGALRDICTVSHFHPVNDEHGPYDVTMGLIDARLMIAIVNAEGEQLMTQYLSLRPYRKIIDDYFLMIKSFEAARLTANPAKLEAIDMGRRGLHNEGAELLQERLHGKIDIDFETARKIFTLICALHRDHMRTLG
jgi:uncharacterized protein (UPF0262 family)